MTDIVSLCEHSQAIEAKITNDLAQMGQAAKLEAKIEEQKAKLQRASAVSFLTLFSYVVLNHILIRPKNMEACSKKPLNTPVWKQQRIPHSNYLCNAPECHSNCHSFRLFTPISRLLRLRCATCNHSHRSYFRTPHAWMQDTQASVDEGWEAAKA